MRKLGWTLNKVFGLSYWSKGVIDLFAKPRYSILPKGSKYMVKASRYFKDKKLALEWAESMLLADTMFQERMKYQPDKEGRL